MIQVLDRVPTVPGKVILTPVSGEANTFIMTRADAPTIAGTPVNKALFDSIPNLIFTNTDVLTSAFVANTTYETWGYNYRASITLAGVTSAMVPRVVFNVQDVVESNYAPVAVSYNGGIYIYARAVPLATLTIPTIEITRGLA